MQKEYAIQFYKTINKLLCNLSFAGQYIYKNVHVQEYDTCQDVTFNTFFTLP